ncbi:hypothetical protein CBER1_04497 [Cercospora berteroae]|uniref:DNA2/NAM7 helicase-like C-terminal domain-containing protein n=1 Tax=Cercospora berteroae TaxID=357750 RepID=A0A2S6CF72_9PEZI|nr:hypothetical protein CBER1_04497 [Cercospora berteroae]
MPDKRVPAAESAASKVFATPEILGAILGHLDPVEFTQVQLAHPYCLDVAKNFPHLRRQFFLQQEPGAIDGGFQLNPIFEMVFRIFGWSMGPTELVRRYPEEAILRYRPSRLHLCQDWKDEFRFSIRQSYEHVQKAGNTNKEPYWKEEGDQLRSFRSAHDQLASPPEETTESEDDYEKYLEELRTQIPRCTSPRALLMDESSQMTEARAAHSVVLAAQNILDRVLIIGDPNQLPSAIFSLRNIFSEYGKKSLMERLINAGLRPIALAEQYRMHPSISSILNSTIYDGKLRDRSTVRGREHAIKFQNFMAQLATRSKTPFNTATSSIMISPERRADFHFGSQMMQGSTSRYNVQTAVIVLRTIFWLLEKGKFEQEDIIVTTFYKNQKRLLEAILAPLYPRVRVWTGDGSQGKEGRIHVIDCTILGGAVGENIGFLGTDPRRFSLALSGAQDAGIVICSRDFCNGKHVSTPWPAFTEEHAKANAIIGDEMWAGTLLPENLNSILESVLPDFSRRAGKPKVKTTLAAGALMPIKGTEAPLERCHTNVEAFASSIGERLRVCLKESLLYPLCPNCMHTPVPSQLISRDTPFGEAGTSILAGNMFKNLVEKLRQRHEAHGLGDQADPIPTWEKLGAEFVPQHNHINEDGQVKNARKHTIITDAALRYIKTRTAQQCAQSVLRLRLKVFYLLGEGVLQLHEVDMTIFMLPIEPISKVGAIFNECRYRNPPMHSEGPFFQIRKTQGRERRHVHV